MKRSDVIGKQFENKMGESGVVVKYKDNHHVTIKTTNGYLKTTTLQHLKDKSWHTPYTKTKFDNGYFGEGKYLYSDPAYTCWCSMLQRVYDEKYKQKKPTYKDCTCCDEWLNYQNFAKWYEDNKWSCEDTLCLDKDIIKKNNKEYSPTTCCLVPNSINCIFTKNNVSRGELPIGVKRPNNNPNKFRAYLSVGLINKDKDRIWSKLYDNPLDAFKWYKRNKEEYLVKVANMYKDKYSDFPKRIYDAMCNYKVDIND